MAHRKRDSSSAGHKAQAGGETAENRRRRDPARRGETRQETPPPVRQSESAVEGWQGGRPAAAGRAAATAVVPVVRDVAGRDLAVACAAARSAVALGRPRAAPRERILSGVYRRSMYQVPRMPFWPCRRRADPVDPMMGVDEIGVSPVPLAAERKTGAGVVDRLAAGWEIMHYRRDTPRRACDAWCETFAGRSRRRVRSE